jgi:hypothetical protein
MSPRTKRRKSSTKRHNLDFEKVDVCPVDCFASSGGRLEGMQYSERILWQAVRSPFSYAVLFPNPFADLVDIRDSGIPISSISGERCARPSWTFFAQNGLDTHRFIQSRLAWYLQRAARDPCPVAVPCCYSVWAASGWLWSLRS